MREIKRKRRVERINDSDRGRKNEEIPLKKDLILFLHLHSRNVQFRTVFGVQPICRRILTMHFFPMYRPFMAYPFFFKKKEKKK